MRDTKLRHVAELRGLEILFGQITPVPMDGSLLLPGGDACDHLEESALATAGGTDHRHKLPPSEVC